MKDRLWLVSAGLLGLVSLVCAVPCSAQGAEVKEKPPMYSYIANWVVPRAQWGEMAKAADEDKAILDKALADGTIVGYGSDETLVHQSDDVTHDNWWSAMSLAGLIKVLDQISAAGNNTTPALVNATKHFDEVMVSRHYNWKPGSWKNGYVHVGQYALKKDAPDDALDVMSKQVVVPLFEKLVADGTVREYEVDTEAIHTQAPNRFWIVYVVSSPEGLDTVQGALIKLLGSQPLTGPALGAMTDDTDHRDGLARGQGIFK